MDDSRQPVCNPKYAGSEILRKIHEVVLVSSRDHEALTFPDLMQGQERDHVIVLVNEARRCIAPKDLAEDAPHRIPESALWAATAEAGTGCMSPETTPAVMPDTEYQIQRRWGSPRREYQDPASSTEQ